MFETGNHDENANSALVLRENAFALLTVLVEVLKRPNISSNI